MNRLNATLKKDRIISIDVLRGIAILGIIIMNIQSFTMPLAAYMNPHVFGDMEGLNYWVWALSYILISEKFMTLFSILFGAGIILFNTKGDGLIKTGKLHYRRNFILLIFGLIHAYVIWYGDILTAYALCAFLAFVFRKKKVKTLLIVGAAFFIVPSLFYLFSYASTPYWPQEQIDEMNKMLAPNIDEINKEITAMQGNWFEQNAVRIKTAIMLQTQMFLMQVFWKVMGLMLLGMALLKSGVLSAQKSKMFYVKITLIGFSIGLYLAISGLIFNAKNVENVFKLMFLGSHFNYLGSLPMALGYIGLIMLIAKSDKFSRFKSLMSKVGRMAFTNYILTSILAVILFTGTGFGLYGTIERTTQILITFAFWLILIVFSNIWLKHYKFGPLEWLWRSLTYGHFQSFKKSE